MKKVTQDFVDKKWKEHKFLMQSIPYFWEGHWMGYVWIFYYEPYEPISNRLRVDSFPYGAVGHTTRKYNRAEFYYVTK